MDVVIRGVIAILNFKFFGGNQTQMQNVQGKKAREKEMEEEIAFNVLLSFAQGHNIG